MWKWLTQLLCKNHIWITENLGGGFTYNICVKCDKVGGYCWPKEKPLKKP